jgi:hypothetical protein
VVSIALALAFLVAQEANSPAPVQAPPVPAAAPAQASAFLDAAPAEVGLDPEALAKLGARRRMSPACGILCRRRRREAATQRQYGDCTDYTPRERSIDGRCAVAARWRVVHDAARF